MDPTGVVDYMMEVESNYYGDSANYFLSRHFRVELTRNGGTLHHKVTVGVINRTPFGSEDRVVYKADFRLYVGANASSTSDNLRPIKYPDPTPSSDLMLLSGWLPDVPCCGGQGSAVFEYNTPWPIRDNRYFLYWQKQPGVSNDKVDVIWNDGSGHVYSASGDLNGDRVITLTPTAVFLSPGQPGQAVLPSLNLG